MNKTVRKPWKWKRGAGDPEPVDTRPSIPAAEQRVPTQVKRLEMDIPPDDPLLAHLLKASGVIDIERLDLNSPALRSLKEAGVKLAAPLVSQGELIGVLNLGPRLSEQEYSSDDLRLISSLATQAAPALRVAQLARQQQIEAGRRERMDQELRVARIIQQTLLPKDLPALPGWQLAAHWQPARAVSGDFYDFINFPDGRLGIVIADVTDKGVPAALIMATTRSILRAVSERLASPGEVLERVNNLLVPDIPPNMFVTCLFMILDPANGCLQFANAGQNLPFLQNAGGVVELRATGMPLGLMPDMTYEQQEVLLAPGDSLVMCSDGLVEAHNPQGEMFGTPRLRSLLADCAGRPGGACGPDMIDLLRSSLADFTGPGWEQEDDVTLVSLDYMGTGKPEQPALTVEADAEKGWQTLAEFELPSRLGSEQQSMEAVAEAVSPLGLPRERLERLKTAVGEATMNAIEHGNHFQQETPVAVEVRASGERLVVRVRDHGRGQSQVEYQDPDLEAKLEGLQTMRGWGMHLMRNLVDEVNSIADSEHHTLELVLHL